MNKRNLGWILFFVIECFFLFASFQIAAATNTTSDFNVFWQAGKNYGDGVSLYQQIGGACRYIYPPFAAMLFRFFSLFSLKTAAVIFAFVNFQLWIGIFYYTRAIINRCNLSKRNINISLLAGLILSARYFIYHVHFIQMNELVLLLSLIGVKAFIDKKNMVAALLLVVASFIKITPILILIWILSKSNWRIYLYTLLFAIACIILPLLMRGMDTGLTDIKEYYQTFLGPFMNGRVETGNENQGLNSALYKVFSPTPEGIQFGYFIKEIPASTLSIISKILTLTVLLVFTIVLGYARFIRKTISVLEISIVLLITLLISGVTWEYHFVSLSFVFAVLSAQFLNASSKEKPAFYILLLFALANAIIGSSTIGMLLYRKTCGFSFLTILALAIAVLQVYYFFKKDKNYLAISAPHQT